MLHLQQMQSGAAGPKVKPVCQCTRTQVEEREEKQQPNLSGVMPSLVFMAKTFGFVHGVCWYGHSGVPAGADLCW